MITQYVITISPVSGHPLHPDAAYRLYACLLEQLPAEDALWLHDEGSRCVTQFLRCDREKDCYFWTVNLLSDPVAQVLRPVLDTAEQMYIENEAFRITAREVQEVTLESLLLHGRAGNERRSRLHFCSPTAFRQNGRYTIFPQERLILQSLVMRWNEVFPQCPLDDEDAFNAMLAGIHIVDYQLRSTRFSLKGVRIPGFCGSCVMDARLALPLLELWNTLLAFADFAGLGIKTSLGMGGVRSEPL